MLSSDNPWIFTKHKKPEKNINYILTFGLGRVQQKGIIGDSESAIFFKYSFLNKRKKKSYAGVSFSGYNQAFSIPMYENYGDGHSFYIGWKEFDRTSYMLAYSCLNIIGNGKSFNGFYYGYDAGVTFITYEGNPFGLKIWEPIKNLFDSDERTDITIGGNLLLGYAFDKATISFECGLKLLEQKVDHYSLNLSYKNF